MQKLKGQEEELSDSPKLLTSGHLRTRLRTNRVLLEESSLRVVKEVVYFDPLPLVVIAIGYDLAEAEEAAIGID